MALRRQPVSVCCTRAATQVTRSVCACELHRSYRAVAIPQARPKPRKRDAAAVDRARWLLPGTTSTDSLASSHSRSAVPEQRARAVCHPCPTHSGRPNCQTRRREADSHRPLAATPQAASTSSHVRWPALSDPIVAGSRSCPPSEGAADPTRAPIRTAQRAVGVFDSQALLAP